MDRSLLLKRALGVCREGEGIGKVLFVQQLVQLQSTLAQLHSADSCSPYSQLQSDG